MKRILSIGNILICLFALLLLLRFGMILSIFRLLFEFILLLFSEFSSAARLFDLQLFDHFLSVLLFIIIPPALFYINKKVKFLKIYSLPGTGLILLLFAFIFAPIISNCHPDFQKDLSVTRLLPPFSSVLSLKLKTSEESYNNRLDDFAVLRNKIIKNSFDDNLFFCDSLKQAEGEFVLFCGSIQKNVKIPVSNNRQIEPVIEKKYFILGSDELGRDVCARLVYGTRVSILIGLFSVIISLMIGIAFGFIAGFAGSVIDIVISRFTEMLLSFPLIFFIILMLGLFGNSIFTVIFVLGFSGWMSLLKIVKGEVVALKSKDYFLTARQIGLTKKQLLVREVLPVITVPVVVNLIFQFGNVILAESALSFLGFGVGDKYPSWGGMIQSGQAVITTGWWLIVFPGIIIICTLLTANQFGKNLSSYFNTGQLNDK